MLGFLAALLTGLLAGAMLVIGVVLVPFWQELPPAEFRAWFAAHWVRIGALMFPLGVASVLATFAALVPNRSGPNRMSYTVAFAAALAVVIITITINEPANIRFAAPGGLSDAETITLLANWKVWHWIRVTLGLVAFAASLKAGQ